MALQLAKFVISLVIAAGAWYPGFFPIDPTEIKLMAVDDSLTELFLEVPFLDLKQYHPVNPDCFVDAEGAVIGFLVEDIAQYLKDEHDICILTTDGWSDGKPSITTPMTFNRRVNGELIAAPGLARATVATPSVYNMKFIETSKVQSPSWHPYGCTDSIQPFNISLLTTSC